MQKCLIYNESPMLRNNRFAAALNIFWGQFIRENAIHKNTKRFRNIASIVTKHLCLFGIHHNYGEETV